VTLEEYDALLSRYSEGDITWPEFRERLNEADNYPELLNALIQRLPRPPRVLTLTQDEQDDLIRRYAAREITWRELREYDEFEHYGDVIMALGRLDLRIPIAPMEGPNVESRLRGRAILRELLHKQSAELAKQGLRWVAGKLCRVNPDGSTVPVETE
jgi:hypothetical protein